MDNINDEIFTDNKSHLSSLPAPAPGSIPQWGTDPDSEYCVCIPIFSYFRTGQIDMGYVHSAATALQSWRMNTDAEKYGVPIYIWVEHGMECIVQFLMDELNVPRECIIVSTPESSENLSYIVQALGPIYDPQLSRHPVKIILDSEVLVFAPPDQKLEFFETLKNGVPGPVGVQHIWEQWTPIHKTSAAYWVRYFLEDESLRFLQDFTYHTNEMAIAEEKWLSVIRDELSSEAADYFSQPGNVFHLNLFAIRYFDTRDSHMEWWTKAFSILHDDEAASVVYPHIPDAKPLWEMGDIGIEAVMAHDAKDIDYFMPVNRPFIYNYCSHTFNFIYRYFKSLGV